MESRAEDLQKLGLQIKDVPGWVDGQYAPHRYYILDGDHEVSGPFTSTTEAMAAARKYRSDDRKSP